MIEQHNNSVIYRNIDENKIIDFTFIGSNSNNISVVSLYEESNGFILGDAIYYNIKTNHYARALANNTIMSEVIGVVSKIIDKDNFELTIKGDIILDRYNNINDSNILYLSNIITGKLIDTEPNNISKIIGTKIKNGINVNIQRGFHLKNTEEELYTDTRYYTDDEIQEVINTIIKDIY